MSSDCISISDAMWDFVRDGIELTGEALSHARTCGSCAGALAEAQAGVAALNCLKPYPAAPDCRQKVMSRINVASRGIVFGPFAWATFPAAAAVALMMVLYHGSPQQAVRRTAVVRQAPDAVASRAPGSNRSPANRPVPTVVALVPPTPETGSARTGAAGVAPPPASEAPVTDWEFRPGSPGCSPQPIPESFFAKPSLAPALLPAISAGAPETSAAPQRGIAVLASSLGSELSPESLAEFVQRERFSPVVIDWAWITYHWPHTNFAAVNRFIGLMEARKVPVIAMYRPRFLSNPTVATQIGKDGKRTVDHAEICYSDASAREWGISWGGKILEECPSFREIIIYNPLNVCQCAKCKAASAKGPHAAVMNFLSEARAAWRAKQPDVKLGVVYMPYPDFWKAGLGIVDVAHPYLRIKEDVDPAGDVADIKSVRAIVKEKMGSCLGKITWEEGAKVSLDKLRTVDRLAGKAGVPYFFWTFETLFRSNLYEATDVIQALRASSSTASATSGGVATDGPERQLAETLLEQVQQAEQGAVQFAAIDDFARKVREGDAAGKNAMLSLLIETMNDESLGVKSRWPCCYVISRSGDERGVPDIIKILLQDESNTMRAVAAEALGELPSNAAAHDALLQAADKETDSWVRDVLSRKLGTAAKTPATVAGPASAAGVEELAASGPPKPPKGPARPVAKPLPWPFSGDFKDQSIFSNYQTSTDDYIHCALDFLHPVGTPVTAVGSGYVAAIWSRAPHTHDFFIVTPQKGGGRGWCYTHMDPATFTFREGDFIQQGQVLGKLVKFVPNDPNSMDHLDLSYVSFTKNASGQVTPHSLLDPLLFFDWKDTVPPSFLPLRIVSEGTTEQFQPDAAGVVTVRGKVDILAAVTDSAYPGQKALLGVPVVMLSISDGKHTMQKLVLDHRGDVGDKSQTKPTYLSRNETKEVFGAGFFPYYQTLRVTKTDGDGLITARDSDECWDTTMLDSNGKPSWPDGRYSVNVYAWDLAGNRSVAGTIVQVKNEVKDNADPSSAPSSASVGATGGSGPVDGTYTAEQIKSTSTETFLARIANPEPGYHAFSAMWALAAKAKGSDAATRRSIFSMTAAVIDDGSKPFDQRWKCCYMLADTGDEQVVPILIRVLENPDSGLTGFAAEALATMYKDSHSAAAHDALLKAAPRDASVREVLQRRLGETVAEGREAPAPTPVRTPAVVSAVVELAPSGAPQPPPGPARPVADPLPWPFPGDYQAQSIFNNYQQATDIYIHCGLDFIHPAGTAVRAVGSGYVAAIYTNYPQWVTHHFFIVTPTKGGNRGWCYTHVDPRTYSFKEGDFVNEGQVLGSLVDFSLGDKPGVAHLHLHYVSFTRDASGKVKVHSLLDPLYFFDWKDNVPPSFQPLRFVPEGTLQQFEADDRGVVTVSGRVDVLAAIADSAFQGHMGNLGVPVVMLSISDGKHTAQRLALDHRGDVGDETKTRPLFLSYDERKTLFNPDSFPRYEVLRVTKTDGDGKITPKDATECWDTTAVDRTGKRVWPDGRYSVNVYAWDIAGNRGVVGATVQVRNGRGGR